MEHESIDPGITDRTLQYGAVLLAASRGDVPRATSLMEEMVASASGRGEGWALTYVDYAKSVLYNGLADYERAAEAAHKAVSANEMAHSSWALPELVEAAVRTGQSASAAAACERLSGMTAASGTHGARGAAALARAQLADGDVADELYRDAIELFSRTRMVSHLARARLCYGEWLRRNNRRAEGGTQLRAAFDAFAAMGANAFAQHARRELEATGEKVRAHREDPGAGLTPQ